MRYEMRGRVIDQFTGDGIGGVRVEAWDKDRHLDDYLGSATTSTDGSFLIGFDDSAFRDIIIEQWPDLYFKVYGNNELLASTEDSVLWNVRNPRTGVTIKVLHLGPKLKVVPMMFWLSVSGDHANQVVDTPYRSELFRRTNGYVVYNSELDGYADWVAAAKAEHSHVRILRYANAHHVPQTTRVAGTWFADCLANGETWGLILRSTGQPKVTNGTHREAWMDITNPSYRAAAVQHLAAQVELHGCDGVALDSCHAQLNPSTPYVNGEVIGTNWLAGCQAFLQELRAALPSGSTIMFNGLWRNHGQAQLDAQAELLPWADLAVVEHYPHDFGGGSNALEINAVLAANPKKRILVSGTRAGENNFYTYAADLQNARWSLGWYLMGKTPWAHFRYGQNLQVNRLPLERSGATTISGYANLHLDEPLGPATAHGSGGYERVFKGGVAFVSPDSGAQGFVVPFDAWSVTGNQYQSGVRVKVPARDGLILMRSPVPPPADVVEYDVSVPATDYLMEMVTDEWRYTTLEVGVRSIDPDSALLFRFETDDDPRPFGVLRIMPTGGSFSPGNVDYPYRQVTTLGAAHVTGPTYPTSGTLISLSVDLTALSVPCYQVRSVRVVGSVEMEYLRLRTPTPI